MGVVCGDGSDAGLPGGSGKFFCGGRAGRGDGRGDDGREDWKEDLGHFSEGFVFHAAEDEDEVQRTGYSVQKGGNSGAEGPHTSRIVRDVEQDAGFAGKVEALEAAGPLCIAYSLGDVGWGDFETVMVT